MQFRNQFCLGRLAQQGYWSDLRADTGTLFFPDNTQTKRSHTQLLKEESLFFVKGTMVVSVNDFWLPRRLQELHQALLRFLRSFFFLHGHDCIHCAAKSCTTTGEAMIVPRCTFFTGNFVIRRNQVTTMFRSAPRLYQHVFCKKPLLFASSSRHHNWGPSGSDCKCCVYPSPVPLLLAAPLEIHEMTWKCPDFPALGFSKALLEYFHQLKFSLKSCCQSGNSCDISLCTSSDSPFLFVFSVSVVSCSGSRRNSPLVLPILSETGFLVYLLT